MTYRASFALALVGLSKPISSLCSCPDLPPPPIPMPSAPPSLRFLFSSLCFCRQGAPVAVSRCGTSRNHSSGLLVPWSTDCVPHNIRGWPRPCEIRMDRTAGLDRNNVLIAVLMTGLYLHMFSQAYPSLCPLVTEPKPCQYPTARATNGGVRDARDAAWGSQGRREGKSNASQ